MVTRASQVLGSDIKLWQANACMLDYEDAHVHISGLSMCMHIGAVT